MIFTFPHDPNGTNETLFQNTKLELSPGITVLVGGNGSGKSTLLHLIERHCLENEIPCFSFDNKMQGGTHAMSAAEWSGDVDSLTSLAFHSKGEQSAEKSVPCKMAAIATQVKPVFSTSLPTRS